MRLAQTRWCFASIAIAICAQADFANAQTLEELQKKYHIDAADMQKMRKLFAADHTKTVVKKPDPAKKSSEPGSAQASAKADNPKVASTCWTATADDATNSPWQCLLRQDWQDIGILAGPTPIDKATGASASYSDDHIAKNKIWAVHGTGAVVYRKFTGVGPEPRLVLFEKSFAAYATINKLYNTDPKLASKNIDTLAAGGAVEFGWRNTPKKIQNYLQFRAGVVNDRIKDTTAVNATAAWLPVNNDYHIHHPEQFVGNIGYSFDPQLLAQFASTTDRKSPLLFSNHYQSMRIGPQLTLLLFPFVQDGSFWSHLSANVTYHWWQEALYGNQQDWFKSSVTYNFDPDGNFGLTGSYQRGHSEETGAQTNLFMLSLTGKI